MEGILHPVSIHGSPVIHFPATELADLKSRLASGHTISSVHDTGKHKAGDIVMSSLGMLRVLNVKPVAPHELTAHSGAMKAHVAGERGDMLELKKLGSAPALEVLEQRKTAFNWGSIGYPLLGAGLAGGAAVGAEHLGVFGHPAEPASPTFSDDAPADPPAPAPTPTPAGDQPAPVVTGQPAPAAPTAAQVFQHRLTGLEPAQSQNAADIIDQYAQRDDRLKALLVDEMAKHPNHDWRQADQASFDPLVKAKSPFYFPDPVGRFHTATNGMFQALEAASPAEEQNALRIMQLHRAGLK
jgi:hypothetical protein